MKKNTMSKNEVTYLLPHFSKDVFEADTHKCYQMIWEKAATLDYIPTTLDDLKKIAFRDVKILMKQNKRFSNAVMVLCNDFVVDMIEDAKEYYAEQGRECKCLKNVHTMDGALKSGFYGKDYDSSKKFIISCILDYLYYELFDE